MAGGREQNGLADAGGAAKHRSCHDGAVAFDGEDPVDGKAENAARFGTPVFLGKRRERFFQFFEAISGRVRNRYDRSLFQERSGD